MYVLIPLLASIFSVFAAPPTVHLGKTVLSGRVAVPGQEFFGGIPYAEPPIGHLRLRPPVSKTSLGVKKFDATEFGVPCLQQPSAAANTSSEDCLTLNVFRPSESICKNKSLPVLVWVHGGGFVAGASSLYNASKIVSQSVSRGTPVVFVSLNYRLGTLGFPPGREATSAGILNLAMKDQLLALQWVQDNIGAFGGDPKKVTIFGQSAGSVCISGLLMNSNLQRFARAMIFQSGSPATAPQFNGTHRQVDWDNFVRAIPQCASTLNNSTSLNCVRTQVNSSVLIHAIGVATGQANEDFPWVPTQDGPGGLMPDLPSKLFAEGRFAHLPFIAGTTIDEGSIFTSTSVNSTEGVRNQILTNFTVTVPSPALEAAADRVLEIYPNDPALGVPYNTGNNTFGFSSQFKRLASIVGDAFLIANRRALNHVGIDNGVKSYGYIFTDPPPPNVFPAFFGVPHGLDVGYLFGAVAGTPGVPPTDPKSILLAVQMIDYWVSFATSLDPNDGHGTKRAHWPEYTTKNQVVMQLNSENLTAIPDNYRGEQIAFFNSHPTLFRH
ncbi:extracellular triacylglycerol lipase precursor [Mycena crocata]|nr:extracellular triacylglycerol lipase precursor [Mycena crocata]